MPNPLDLSLVSRARNLNALASRAFDVLVIGSGINGAAIACELAQQGLAVALIDKGDFASATSQSSGGLIWGGIKYLAEGRLGLVARLCAERARFVARAPHCVRERRFLAPVFKDDPHGLAALAWGARLYWALGGFRRSHRPVALRTPEAVLALAPHLRGDRLVGGVLYTDAQIVTSDAHLTFEIVRTAAARGAIVANAVGAEAFRIEGGRVAGVDAVDRLTGARFAIASKVAVNATGIWADRTRDAAGVRDAPHRLALRRGTFLFFRPEDFEARAQATPDVCVVIQSEGDGRPFFICPWGPVMMVGTTDVDHDPAALDDIRTTPDEVSFILRELRARFRLKPGAGAARAVESRVGVRPLAVRRDVDPASLAGEEALSLSRDHAVDFDAPRRLFTVLGGKLTPARQVAAEVAEAIARRVPDVWAGRPMRDTRRAPLLAAEGLCGPGALETFTADVRGEAAALGLPPGVAEHLVAHHGNGTRAVLDRVRADRALGEPVYPPSPGGPWQGRAEEEAGIPPKLRRSEGGWAGPPGFGEASPQGGYDQASACFRPGLPYVWAEVRAHAEGSMVTCLDDLMRRRTNLAQWVPFGGFGAGVGGGCGPRSPAEHEAIVRRVAEEIARANGWPPGRVQGLVDDYRAIVGRRNAWREA